MDSTWGEGNSTLHLGSTIGDIDVIKCLLSRNLNIHCKNRAGLTPLDVAADDETQSLFRQFRNNTRSTPAAAARDAKRSGNVERTSQTNKNLISSSSYTGKIDVQMTVTHKEVSVAVAAPAAEPIEKGQLRDIKEAASKTSSTVSLPFIAPTSSSINSELISLFATQTLLMAAPTTTMQTSITPAPITSHSTLKGSTSTSSLFNNPFLQADRDLVPVDQSTKNSSFFRNGGSLNSAKLKIVANDNEKARPSISSSISSATFPKNLASSAILKNSNWSAKRSLTSLDWSNSSESGIPASAIPTPPLPITAIDNTTEAQISATLTVNLPKVAEKESIASALPRTIITSPVVIVEKGGDKPDSVKSFRSSLTSSYGSRFQQQPPPKASDLIKKFDRPSNRVVGPSIVPSSQGVLGLGVGRSYPTTRNLKSLGYIKPALEAQTSPAIGINHIQKSSNHTTTPDSQEALPIVNIPATTISEDLMDAPAEPQFETKETDEYCPSLVDGEPDEKSPTYDFVCLEPKSSSLEDTAVIASSQPTPITIENQLNVEQVESTFSADKCLLDQFVGKKEGGIEDIEIIKSITISDLKIEVCI